MFIYFEDKYVNFDLVRHIERWNRVITDRQTDYILLVKSAEEDYSEHFDSNVVREERLKGLLKQLGTEIVKYPRD